MQSIRLALLTLVAFFGAALPAAAQSPAAGSMASGTLLPVWIVILVVGIVVFVAATSISVRSLK
jgi:hypothetical protein